MDRDSFPQLLEGDTGWPVLKIPMSHPPDDIKIQVSESHIIPNAHDIDIRCASYSPISVFVNGTPVFNGDAPYVD